MDLEEGIGSHTEQEVEEIRTQMVGSYLISLGSDAKRLFMVGGNVGGILPTRVLPETTKLKGNRIEIVFVPVPDGQEFSPLRGSLR